MTTQTATNRPANFLSAVFSQLGWPLLWGMAAWVGFYLLLEYGLIGGATMRRYFMGHPVEYIESALFFIGLAALTVRLFNIYGQHRSLSKVVMPAVPEGGNQPEDAGDLLAWVDGLPAAMANHYLVRRLRDALQYVQQKGTADELDEQVRHLAEEDYARQHEGYALVRLVIWAIPILGFLGTVIGITMAISQLAPESLTESTAALTGSLSIAFDTTTVALGLSIVLMFAQFLIERFEGELISNVNIRANNELVGRFETIGGSNDPLVQSVRKMSNELIETSRALIDKQTQLWRQTIEDAHTRWANLNDSASEKLQTALAHSIDQSLTQHTQRLAEVEAAATERMQATELAASTRQAENEALSQQRLIESQQNTMARLAEAEQVSHARLTKTEDAAAERAKLLTSSLSEAISQYAGVVKSQQAELVRQGDLMQQAVEASGQVTQLQEALNNNLESLAGAKHFEETLNTLSAAVHLLTGRVEQTPRKRGERAA